MKKISRGKERENQRGGGGSEGESERAGGKETRREREANKENGRRGMEAHNKEEPGVWSDGSVEPGLSRTRRGNPGECNKTNVGKGTSEESAERRKKEKKTPEGPS